MATRILKHVDRYPLRHERHQSADVYSGTKEALIEAGHAKDGQFPGDPGCGTTMCRFDAEGALMRRGQRGEALSIHRKGKRFIVRVPVDKQEEKRRAEEQEREWETLRQAAQVQEEIAKAQAELAELPTESKAFAHKAAEFFWRTYNVFWREYVECERHESGFRFTRDSRDTIEDLAHGLYWEIRWAESTYQATYRMKKLTEARAKAAKLDMPLQRLLADAQARRLVETRQAP